MWNKIVQAFKIKDLRNRILFTILLLLMIRILSHIPIPGIDVDKLQLFFTRSKGLGLLDIFSGGAMKNFSIAMMGVGPYINASIIMQLLTHVVPSLEALQKEGEDGRKKINQWTRWISVPLAFLQSYGMIMLLRSQGQGLVGDLGIGQFLSVILITATGTVLLMWLGELITEKGIGNGISLIIALGIIAGMPSIVQSLWVANQGTGVSGIISIAGLIILSIIVIVSIIYTNEGNRLIPVSYARRVQGNRLYGGGDTQLPLKLNTAGVIPIIFALSFMIFPNMISQFLSNARTPWLAHAAKWVGSTFSISPPTIWYTLLYFVLVVAFTFFYTSVIFNPKEISENIQKQGGFVPGIRPGNETSKYLGFIILRLTFSGALFLGIIAVLPNIVDLIKSGHQSVDTLIGGTSILIIVSVILETYRQLQAQMIMRSYEDY
ncbi:MAG TPA: preprotein translocase subunit SecY [Patescibacteria group bacterium]|nr:preprotein translocase subunit SecY [Patescibacteria group bacterium]